jgi:hypothetical protein
VVIVSDADACGLGDFRYGWRVATPRWNVLLPEELARIRPLGPTKTAELAGRAPAFHQYPSPFDPTAYHVVSELSLREVEAEAGRLWLRSLPVPASEELYLVWKHFGTPTGAVVTEWGLVETYWDDFWYPFDIVVAFDESLAWMVIFGPQEHVVFAERGGVPPGTPESDWRRGKNLLRSTLD